MESFRLLSEKIDLDCYPLLREVPRSSEVPGYILIEQFALQGIRGGVSVGCLATALFFYLVHRPRLSFADRSLARLHHYLIPSIGYYSPLGALGGTIFNILQYEKESSPELLRKQLEVEISAAKRSKVLRDRRRDVISTRARNEQSLWSKLMVRLGIEKDPVETALARYGLQDRIGWKEMLSPPQLAFISLLSNSARGRRDCEENKNRTACPTTNNDEIIGFHKKKGDGAKHTPIDSPLLLAATVPAASADGLEASTLCKEAPLFQTFSCSGRYSKIQIDYLVSRALYYRTDKTYDRWTTTARRGGTCGIVAFWLLWNAKVSLLLRTSVGFGFGIAAGGLVSSIKLDEIFAHMGDFA